MTREAHSLLRLPRGEVAIRVRRSRRARRITLRVDARDDSVVLVLPGRASLDEGLSFARQKARWIERRLGELPPRLSFVAGAAVPYLGIEHEIRLWPGRRRVWREDGAINVAGPYESLGRRVGDWLRAEAKRELGLRAHDKAARMGRRVARVGVRDMRSRWGSCTSTGNLSFCWRLIMAPEPVLDYVVAHEVAHLEAMHHGPSFWRLVATLTDGMDEARAWLRQHGNALHRYG